MKAIFNFMLVSLTVLEISDDKYSCKVKATLDLGDNNSETVLEDVYITGLAKYRFKHSDKFVVGKTYTASNNSDNYLNCPIKLIRTCDTKTGKLMFVLKVVNEGISKVNDYYTPNGQLVKSRQFSTIPQSKWFRYSDYYAKNREKYETNLEKVKAKA